MEGGTQERFEEQACSPSLVGGLQQQAIYLSASNLVLSLTAFLGNSLILTALHKESSLHPPSKLLFRCLVTTDLLVGLVSQPLFSTHWMCVVYEQWSLCRLAFDAFSMTSYALCSVSLFTMTAISMDRLLALLLGLRYRQIVTLKRTYIIVATIWVVSGVAALCEPLDGRITDWYGTMITLSCSMMTIASYTKIFRTLSRHQAQVQDHFQQQPSQPNALNVAQYRKAVSSTLWVQLALVVCYVPFSIVEVVMTYSKTYSSNFVVSWGIAVALIYCNSTLNPFLYCWKSSEADNQTSTLPPMELDSSRVQHSYQHILR
ncbi:Melanocyte-stimulating hormone receptor [Stylophora pistillata]|uniref:Melanocyte-stimulating hormone receptor n=1 Tax=Stylophora pistillata TaxID=50429 RepID=A0A2B4R8J6_STYPI|nr:Melanocyte-stimulating hormone receptor [Stylophora pistillata]